MFAFEDRWMIDFDYVLSNTFHRQIEEVNRKFGTSLTHEDFPDWDLTNVLTQEQLEYMWSDEVFLNEDFQMSCTPSSFARNFLEACNGEHMMVVSDRPQALYGVTRRWLQAHFPNNIFNLQLTRSPHSQSDQGLSIPTKQDIIREYQLNMVVEDAPHHVLAAYPIESVDHIYLMDTPSNRMIAENEKIIRVSSWEEIEDIEDSGAWLERRIRHGASCVCRSHVLGENHGCKCVAV